VAPTQAPQKGQEQLGIIEHHGMFQSHDDLIGYNFTPSGIGAAQKNYKLVS